ncbi:MAG: 16S rRNA (adenine(1518)-N(6)/adenine(1519)-N(6))-dimethyltransferase RsmA [Atribacterota bacterium]|jgi:16S rRNA (adenine1518-N6/adenine1519-N6)-dimethyltransferase|nr:16S rRNA (adenine(1518)-N(6)/adenine(1519)-N(6))-dimethyltransferase RsmA [Atribacterota bacterium]
MPESPSIPTLPLKKLREYLEKYKISPHKKLGQNFLIDNNIKAIIANTLNLEREEALFEIGTGLGGLTLSLIPLVKHVFSIERDTRFKPILDDIFSPYSDRVTVIYENVLTFDLAQFLNQKKGEGFHIEKLIGNLPYSISFPLLKKIIEMRSLLKVAVIVVQKEVADKMLAKPGSKEYGLLSVLFSYYTRTEKIRLIKPDVFFPKPKIESMLIRIHFLEEPKIKVIDEKLFFDIVHAIFQYRRKSLHNALKSYFGTCLPGNLLEKALEEAGINPNQRGEALPLEELPRLTKVLKGIMVHQSL